jgi:hypothetical protein
MEGSIPFALVESCGVSNGGGLLVVAVLKFAVVLAVLVGLWY